ncbi:MAG: hypothetical protein LQ347_006758 [Umbilicaria vellea]|nr:MAG: hypothetical protein LQ347_006758 [Umbilicaria vellea]
MKQLQSVNCPTLFHRVDRGRRRHHRDFALRYKGNRTADIRNKYVSLGCRRGRVGSLYSTAWNVRYTKLVKRFNKDGRRTKSPEERGLGRKEQPIKDPWARHIAAAAAVDINRFKKIWANIEPRIKRSTWPTVMYWALSYDPERALAILAATLIGEDYTPPPYAVADSLDYLACVFLKGVSQPDPIQVQRIRRVVSIHIEWSCYQTENYRGVTQRTIYLLAKHCRGLQQLRLYEMIRQCNTFIHTNTLLHLMESFVDTGELAKAMEMLRRIVKSGADLNLLHIQMGCGRLLRGSSELEATHRISYRIRSNILAEMLELGVPLSLMMYNVVILNAVEAGQMDFAYKIYGMIRASKFEPNAYTYSILLKGIKHGMDEVFVSKLFQRAKDAGVLSQSHHLVGQLLYITYLYRPENGFDELLPNYEQYMDNQPLKDLGLLQGRTDVTSQSQVELLQPDAPVLGIMIAAYLMQHRDSDHIPALYARYHELVEAGHLLVAPLAETDYTANVFLKTLGRRRVNLPLCTTIFEHMLKASASPTVKYAAPTVRTWSILLAAFTGHGQMTAGEKIMTMMRHRGIKPDRVTWNTLLKGYAGEQDVEGTIRAMRRMENAGYVVEEDTMNAFGGVVDRNVLMRAFERAVREEEEASSEHHPTDDEDELEIDGERYARPEIEE